MNNISMRLAGLTAISAALLVAAASESRATDLNGTVNTGVQSSTVVTTPDGSTVVKGVVDTGTAQADKVMTRTESATTKAVKANGEVTSRTETSVDVEAETGNDVAVEGGPASSQTSTRTTLSTGADTGIVKETETRAVTTAVEKKDGVVTTLKSKVSGTSVPSTQKEVRTETDVRTTTATGVNADDNGASVDGGTTTTTGVGIQVR